MVIIFVIFINSIGAVEGDELFSKDEWEKLSPDDKAQALSYYNGFMGNPAAIVENNITEPLKRHCTGYLSAAITGLNLDGKLYMVWKNDDSTFKIVVKDDLKMICNYTKDYKLYSAHYMDIELYSNTVLIKKIVMENREK